MKNFYLLYGEDKELINKEIDSLVLFYQRKG